MSTVSSTEPSEPPLVSRVDWPEVEKAVRRQQRNREVHTPPISLYRWWARRSHALIGALLDAAVEAADGDKITVADPFSGGGTVAVESRRRGLPTYAQDLHPWAVTGLATALDAVDAKDLEQAATELLDSLEEVRADLYVSKCPRHDGHSETLTTFWARRTNCPDCSTPSFLFPYSLVTLDSRKAGEEYGWWGCGACGHLTRSRLDIIDRRCGGCHRRLASPDRSLLPDRIATCPNAACRTSYDAFRLAPNFVPVLVQRACVADGRQIVHFDRPTQADVALAKVPPPPLPSSLGENIPLGLETSVLRRVGFSRWSDLYPPRQLRVLLEAAGRADSMEIPSRYRARLLLAIAGAAEMAGHVSRWDRYYPKAFEALANHRFGVTGLSCETNLLATRGRGTLRRRFRASVQAAAWVGEQIPEVSSPHWLPPRHRRTRLTGGLVVSAGTSERQRLRDASVDLVLTDPPYFDDVQYAELASLFLAWARGIGLLAESVEVDARAEAVANTARGSSVEDYRRRLTAIFRESRRTLKPNGRVLLTFHNSDVRAWWALARALRTAGLEIAGLAVSAAENETDHSKRGRLAFTKDLVIECRVRGTSARAVTIITEPGDAESLELLAAGRCLVDGGADSLDSFRNRLHLMRGDCTPQRIGRSTHAQLHDRA